MIYVGTSGYSYPDWIGPFYPDGIRKDGMLEYYASRFPSVEINSTYYNPMSAKAFENMNRRTPQDFRFSVKMPGAVTHPSKSEALALSDDGVAFRENVQPLFDAGKLACVLMQFPNSFRYGERAREYLEMVREAFRSVPLVAEFRNREWQNGEVYRLLQTLHVGWCNVDEPQFKALMRPSADAIGSCGYVRFHGRNYQQWWRGDNATRYDYRYSAEELQPWVDRVADIDHEVKETLAFFNNHRRGQAVENAEMFSAMLRARFGEQSVPLAERLREAVEKAKNKRR